MSSVASPALHFAAATREGLQIAAGGIPSEDTKPISKRLHTPKINTSADPGPASSTNSTKKRQQTKGSDDEFQLEARSSPTCRLVWVDGMVFEIVNPLRAPTASHSTSTEFQSQALQSLLADDDNDDDDDYDSDTSSSSYFSLLEAHSPSGPGGQTGRTMWVDGVEFEMVSVPFPATLPAIHSTTTARSSELSDSCSEDDESDFSDGGQTMWVDGIKFEIVSLPSTVRSATLKPPKELADVKLGMVSRSVMSPRSSAKTDSDIEDDEYRPFSPESNTSSMSPVYSERSPPQIPSTRPEGLYSDIDYLGHRMRDIGSPSSSQDDEGQELNVPWAEYSPPDVFTGYLWPATSERDYIPTVPSLSEIEDYINALEAFYESSRDQVGVEDTSAGAVMI